MIQKIRTLAFLAAVAMLASAGAVWSQGGQTHIGVSVSGGVFPVINGITNLRDGTQLFVIVKKPWLPDGAQRISRGVPACEDDCIPATDSRGVMGAIVSVRDGGFVAGPFSFNGKPFKPGAYPLEISLSPDPKTATVEELQAMNDPPIFASTIQVTPQGAALAAPLSIAPPTKEATLAEPEVNALRAKLMALWVPPAGTSADPAKFVITLRVRLARNRRLAGPPEVLTKGDSVLFAATRDSAIRAVVAAQPYEMLQDSSYEAWKEMELNFDPREAAHPATGAAPPPASAPQRTASFPAQKWKRVEADNGAAYAIDMNSISRSGPDVAGRTQADAVVCVVENNACDIMNMRRWIFYCSQNHVMELTDTGFTPSIYVPPLSIGRRVLDIACGR